MARRDEWGKRDAGETGFDSESELVQTHVINLVVNYQITLFFQKKNKMIA